MCWYELVEEVEEAVEASEKTEAQSESELPFESCDNLGEMWPLIWLGSGAMTGLGS